jgi:hypothetical protein
MEFTPNSFSPQCPGASIYRLGAQVSVRQNIPGHRPDGGHGPFGRTTVQTDFPKFSQRNLLLFKDIVRTVARPLQVISL